MRFLLRLVTGYIIFPIAWTAFIIFLLCIPGDDIPDTSSFLPPYFDKIVHFGLFAGFAFLWTAYFFLRSKESSPKKFLIIFGILGLFLGIALEFVQLYFIPNRSFDGIDIIADSAGVAFGAAFFYWWNKL